LDVYHDVRDALAGGNLYFYYCEGKITYPSVPAQMFPFTSRRSIPATSRARKGWSRCTPGCTAGAGDKDLHFVYLYDSTGAWLTTAS